MTALANQERLITALDGYVRAQLRVVREQTDEAFRAQIRASNVLFDACIDCGMSQDEAAFEAWASDRATSFLCAA